MRTGTLKSVVLSAAVVAAAAGIAASVLSGPASAEVGFGKPGEAVDLVIGYQPYYTESWSGVVINGQELWKKYLPAGSTAKFEIGLQGSVIVGKLLGEKNHLGYMGDMPAIVSTTKQKIVDLRMVAVLGTSKQQCNVFLVSNDAPEFATGKDAVKWMDGKIVAELRIQRTDQRALFNERCGQAVVSQRYSLPVQSDLNNVVIAVESEHFESPRYFDAVAT